MNIKVITLIWSPYYGGNFWPHVTVIFRFNISHTYTLSTLPFFPQETARERQDISNFLCFSSVMSFTWKFQKWYQLACNISYEIPVLMVKT